MLIKNKKLLIILLISAAGLAAAILLWKNVFLPAYQPAGADEVVAIGESMAPKIESADTGTSNSIRKSVRLDLSKDQEVPSGDAKSLVEKLKPLAIAGDSKSSRQIYLILNDCKSAISASLAPRVYVEPIDSSLILPGEDAGQAKVRHEKRRLQGIDSASAKCQNIDAQSIAEAVKWLTLAAKQGDVLAQLLYASNSDAVLGGRQEMLKNPEATREYKRDAMLFLNSALASSGSPEALQALGAAYENGVITQNDPINAYAYRYVANKVSPDQRGQDVLARLGRDFDSRQMNEARARADVIYETCCF